MNSSSCGPSLTLFDICINLDNNQFDHDREEMLLRAHSSGIQYLCLTGSSLESSQYAIDWAQKNPRQYCATVGIHPHAASSATPQVCEQLEALLSHDCVRAVGECGLDYNRNFSPKSDQIQCFEKHIQLSTHHKLPLFLHQRDAHDDFVEILKQRTQPAVVHCFTDTKEVLRSYIDLGCLIGITGWICDPKRGEELRSIVQYIPLDRILIETDAPWLYPKDMRPKPPKRRNEPMYLKHILEKIAFHMGHSPQKIAESSTRNALQFFGMKPCNSYP